MNDKKFLEKLNRFKEKFPDGEEPWRNEWLDSFLELVDKFIRDSGVMTAQSLRPLKRNIYGLLRRKIPSVNIKFSHYLKNRLGAKLKNRHDRVDENIQRFSNDMRAAQLIIEGALILGIKLEDVDRLRKD